MIRALIASNRGPSALSMVDKLPADALAPGQADLLRARALLSMGNWSAAKALLTDLLSRLSDAREAHLLLGTIYEHDGDWQKAAQEYRAAASR
jgi:Tfp pilus assembly protein PilF